MQLFGTKGQKFLHCPNTKGQKFLHCPGTKRQAINLAKARDGLGHPKVRMGRGRDGTLDETGQSRKGKPRSKTENDVLKQEMMF